MSRTPTDEEKEALKELESEDENEDDSKSEDGYVPVQYPSSSSDSDSDSDTDSDTDSDESEVATDFFDPDSYKGGVSEDVLKRKLNPKLSRRVRVGNAVDLCAEASITAKKDVKESVTAIQDQKYNFPPDPENWREEDMGEVWADAPVWMTKPGFDPFCVDEKEARLIKKELDAGREPPIAPFYLPFRKYYPVVPKKYPDISTPKEVIEELDRIEEFLKWVSYIFEDGSSYEGTVWDDVAHGKGVRVALNGMVRYEGEWFRNDMEGHGVVEVDVPFMEPIPGSKLEEQMRAEGEIISRDFMSPEDREWLEKDIEDSLILANGKYQTPFYETKLFMHKFGMTPEKGRYRYAGQWKHGRAHGCGVYEVNEQPTFGRFYFGQLMEDDTHGCDAEVSAMHAGIAEVAAAKARMFVNKPDGMVREYRGPYSDPQHPYMYEEEDVWMAPGFINQFYEVPDYWKMYVHEVDQEREMWLNSFYRAPLRLPMPAELEYWWWNVDENPEFVLLNQELQPDPEDPSKLIQPEDPVILHTPTGRIINYVEDEEHGIRLFWQPPGSKIDPDKAVFLPLGFDEFYGKEMVAVEQPFWIRIRSGFVDIIEGLKGWAEGKKEDIEEKIEQLEKEVALVDAELDLKENMEYMDSELAKLQKEAERKAALGIVEEEEEDVSMSSQPVVDEEGEGVSMSKPVKELEKIPVMKELERTPAVEKKEDEDDDEDDDVVVDDDDEVEVKEDKVDDKDDDDDDDDDDEDEDDGAPSSFGSVEDQNRENGSSRFAASSLSFAGSNVFSLIPPKLQSSFMRWKEGKFQKQSSTPTPTVHPLPLKTRSFSTVRLSPTMGNNIKSLKLRYTRQAHCMEHISRSSSRKYRSKRRDLVETEHTLEHFSILSWHTPLTM